MDRTIWNYIYGPLALTDEQFQRHPTSNAQKRLTHKQNEQRSRERVGDLLPTWYKQIHTKGERSMKRQVIKRTQRGACKKKKKRDGGIRKKVSKFPGKSSSSQLSPLLVFMRALPFRGIPSHHSIPVNGDDEEQREREREGDTNTISECSLRRN